MEKIVIDLEAKTDKAVKDVKALKNEFDNLESSVNDVSNASDKTKKSIDEVATNGGAIAILDQLTGGLATQFKNAYESTRLFNFSLKGTRKALIATGIGALVVSLGLVIAYWDDIKELISGVNSELKKQEENLQEQLKTQTIQLDLLKQQIAIEELKNGFNAKLTAEYKKQLLIKRETNIADLENLQTQLKLAKGNESKRKAEEELVKILFGQKSANSLILKSKEKEKEIQDKINEAKKLTGAIDLELAQIDKAAVDRKKANEDKAKEREKQNSDDLEKIRKALIDTEDKRRKEQLREIKADYDEKIKLAEKYYGEESEKVLELRAARKLAIDTQQAEWDEQDKEEEEAEKERLKKINSDKWDELQKQYDEERDLEKQKIRDKAMVVDAISQFADAESGIGQALLIVKQGLMLQETIMDLKRITFKGKQALGEAAVANAENVAQSSKIGYPWNILTIAAAIGQGIGIINSVKKAVANTKANVSTNTPTPNVSSPSTNSLPPAFNIVGTSGTNQLADAIGGQTQEPVKAFVVASDVSTAQELDRNIIEGASIG